jgi:hypothetical protein
MSNIKVRRRWGRELPDLEVAWLDGDEALLDLRTYSSFLLTVSTRSDGAGTVVLSKASGISAVDPDVTGYTLLLVFAKDELDTLLPGITYKCQLDALDASGKKRGFEEFDWIPLPSIVSAV